jgi:hypothetical protein
MFRRTLRPALLGVLGALVAAAPAAADQATLTVSATPRAPSVTGPGIDCGADCSETYAIGSQEVCEFDPEIKRQICITEPVYQDVTLTRPANGGGWSFAGWGGACAGTATTCTLTMDANKSASAGWSDVAAPSVTLTSPAGPYAAGMMTLAATALDNDRVTGVRFYAGGADLGLDTTAPYGVAHDTGSTNGPLTYRAVAYDPAGHAAEDTHQVTADNTDPLFSAFAGPNGQTFGPGATQTWTFTAADAHSGVASVQCRLEPGGAYGPCSGGTTSHSVAGRPDGTYTIRVKATDRVGRTAEQVRTFAIDATPPQTAITGGPADGSSSTDTSATFTFSSSEPGSSFECRVYPAALTPGAMGDCSGAGTHAASGFSPGTYTFEVVATDPYGNVDGTPAKRSFTVKAPPSGGDTPTTTTGGTGTTTGTATGGTGTATPGTTTPGAGPPFLPLVAAAYRTVGAKTTFSALAVRNAPAGTKVRLTCKGRGCPLRARTFTVRGGKAALVKALKRRGLRTGATIEIRVTGPAGELKLVRYRMRKGRVPARTMQCAAPGGKLGPCG